MSESVARLFILWATFFVFTYENPDWITPRAFKRLPAGLELRTAGQGRLRAPEEFYARPGHQEDAHPQRHFSLPSSTPTPPHLEARPCTPVAQHGWDRERGDRRKIGQQRAEEAEPGARKGRRRMKPDPFTLHCQTAAVVPLIPARWPEQVMGGADAQTQEGDHFNWIQTELQGGLGSKTTCSLVKKFNLHNCSNLHDRC